MCYTFAPTEAAEYLDDEEVLTTEPGVLVGWKIVEDVTDGSYVPKGTLMGWNDFVYLPRQVQADPTTHGFHISATLDQVDLYFSCLDLARKWILYHIVRVLVPRAAVRPDGHVTHMMIIPPGEHETREDIEAVAAVNRELVRARTGGDVRESVHEHKSLPGETANAQSVQSHSVTTA